MECASALSSMTWPGAFAVAGIAFAFAWVMVTLIKNL